MNKVAELLQGFGKVYPEWDKACADYSFVEGKSGLSRVLAFVCLFECP